MSYIMEDDHRRKLTDEQIAMIQVDCGRGLPCGVIALKYGVSRSHIYTLRSQETSEAKKKYMREYQRKKYRERGTK